jgi:uncharacterized protein YidB (DUF937 family)
MGLLDVLNGMQNGPRGQRQPSSGTGGGMSLLTKALLGVLAYKALRHVSGAQAGAAAAPGRPASPPPGGTTATGAVGGLGDILGGLFGGQPGSGKPGAGPGGLGGLLGGAAAGSVLTGGLDNLMKGFQDGGYGKQIQSWIGSGPNQDIAPDDLGRALGSDTVNELSRRTGMGSDELLAGLSQQLPDFIDQLTPNGRLPTTEEASRMV